MSRPLKNRRSDFALDGEYRFEFILARELGKTVSELREILGTSEFYEWVAFYSYEDKMRKAEEAKAKKQR